MRIAVVGGTGSQGRGLAMRWLKKGHEVWIGSRDEVKAKEVATDLARSVSGATVRSGKNADVCEAADIIALSIPFSGQSPVLESIKDAARGKIVIDMTVPLVPGRPPRYREDLEVSAAEMTQQVLAESRVVGAFHNVSAGLLAGAAERLDVDVLVCGDDAEAKDAVAALVGDTGARSIDAGKLEAARTIERITPLLIGLNIRYKKRHVGLKFTDLDVI